MRVIKCIFFTTKDDRGVISALLRAGGKKKQTSQRISWQSAVITAESWWTIKDTINHLRHTFSSVQLCPSSLFVLWFSFWQSPCWEELLVWTDMWTEPSTRFFFPLCQQRWQLCAQLFTQVFCVCTHAHVGAVNWWRRSVQTIHLVKKQNLDIASKARTHSLL